jgi:hypothetical protein
MNTPNDKNPKSSGEEMPAEAPATRPRQPSPSERHPGLKPEDADPSFEDLGVRESENRR